MTERWKQIAKENGVPFERVLLEYVKEELLSALWDRGYGSCLWLRYANGYGGGELAGVFAGRENHRLSFFYKEDDRILPRDGFVPGAAFGEDFFNKLMSHVLIQGTSLQFLGFETRGNRLELQVQCQRMFVPVELQIEPIRNEAVTPKQMELALPVTGRRYTAYRYPVENEAAICLGVILSELELISEMEHYLWLYDIFSQSSIEGVRFQSALRGVLEARHLSFQGDNFSVVLGYGDYPYMRKKWDKMIKRQGIMSLKWKNVIDLLSDAISPVWEASREDIVFFGDWMPEIGRYLD